MLLRWKILFLLSTVCVCSVNGQGDDNIGDVESVPGAPPEGTNDGAVAAVDELPGGTNVVNPTNANYGKITPNTV